MKGKKFMRALFVLLPFMVPHVVGATITINEISYNPEGADGGYEWIELSNTSGAPLSIEGYVFTESGTNHGLNIVNEDLGWYIPTDGFAVIADNATKFLQQHPGFPGLVFDSSFSLLNTGELLEIKDSNDTVLFGFLYDPALGGDGDGSTLGYLDSVWQATSPTPGSANQPFTTNTDPDDSDDDDDNSGNDPDTGDDGTVVTDPPAAYITLTDPDYNQKTIKADAGADKIVLAGVPFWFKGTAYGLAGGVLKEAEFFWNFGNGERAQGSTAIHTYRNPGTYIGTLKIKSGGYRHTDRFEVTVVAPKLEITASATAQTISISNNSPHTIELSKFMIASAQELFTFPEESYIKQYSKITLSADALELTVKDIIKVQLLAPNKTILSSYLGVAAAIRQQVSIIQESIDEKTNTKNPLNETISPQPEQQIVYVRVPEYISSESKASPEPIKENTTAQPSQDSPLAPPTTQQALIIQPQEKNNFTILEYILLALVGVTTGYIGLGEWRRREKQTGDNSIEIKEL